MLAFLVVSGTHFHVEDPGKGVAVLGGEGSGVEIGVAEQLAA